MTITQCTDRAYESKEGSASPCNGSPKTPSSPWSSEGAIYIYRDAIDNTNSTSFGDSFDGEMEFFYINTNAFKTPALKPLKEPKKLPLPPKPQGTLTSQQKLVLISCMVANLVSAACVSLQAPFYPAEAERKGATASEYGFVFGIFELVVFIVSPLYGKYIGKIGPKFLMSAGIFLTASCCILFGLLDKIHDGHSFLTLSFAVRIVEAMGQAAYLTGSFTIIAQEFPDKVSSAFAYLEASFGVGLIVGPSIGGLLYETGGYSLPFAVMGCLLLIATVFTIFFLPVKDKCSETNNLNMFHLLKVPSIAIAGFVTFAASISIGFLLALLEPHLRQFSLSPFVMGIMFVINGGVYAFTTPLWGKLCETKVSPCLACGIGGIFLFISYVLLGPSPILPFRTLLPVCVVGLVFHGLGIAAELVGSFSLAHKDAVKYGFPDDLKTYGLVSGFWTSVFALGAFVGPSGGGVLVDLVGFQAGSQIILFLHLILVFITLWWIIQGKNKTEYEYSAKHEYGTFDEKMTLIY